MRCAAPAIIAAAASIATATAADDHGEVAIVDPIWIAAWGDPGAAVRNAVPMVRLPGTFVPLAQNESVDVEALARQLMQRPRGRRALLALRYGASFWGTRGDTTDRGQLPAVAGPWAETAVSQIGREWPRTLALLKHCGAELDLVVLDLEEWGRMGTWWLDAPQMEALRGDPRWRLPIFGLEPLSSSLHELEAMPASEIKRPGPQGAYLKWNLEIGRATAHVMSEALWKPVREVFPSSRCSNYQGFRSRDRAAPDGNGHQQPHDNIVGNAASPSLYGEIESIVNLAIDDSDPTRVAWSGSKHLKREPWTSFLLCHQQARACVRGAPQTPLMPWIANPSYPGDAPEKPVVAFPRDLRCYDENIRHAALLGVPTFLWWRQDGKSSPSDNDRVDGLISEINAHTLGRIKEPADVEPISFLSEVVVTGGRRHDGKWLWRVTVSPEVAALHEAGTGREWAPTAESLGFWVETAENTAPKWEVARRRGPSEPSFARPVKPAPPP
jgi:hypothetical protein